MHAADAWSKGQVSCCLQAAAGPEGMVALGKSWPADSLMQMKGGIMMRVDAWRFLNDSHGAGVS